jgi:hypothetical protein
MPQSLHHAPDLPVAPFVQLNQDLLLVGRINVRHIIRLGRTIF